MEIRKAKISDTPGICALIESSLDKLLARSDQEVERLIDSFFVIEENGAIVGCACLEVYSTKISEIRSVAVRSDRRAMGYGTKLVNAAIQEAQKLNIREIMVVTSNLDF